jgi:hypothetical protein
MYLRLICAILLLWSVTTIAENSAPGLDASFGCKGVQVVTQRTISNPQKPNDKVQLVGDCSDYIDLSEEVLPMILNGNTIGGGNEYGPYPERPSCWDGDFSSSSGASSDVTYKWTAPADGEYDFYILGASYDCCIELYQFTCPIEPRYPEDFICGNDNWEGTQSRLSAISLSAGQEVLIVADGNGNSEGDFYLMIDNAGQYEPLVCPENTIWGQPGPRIYQGYYLMTSDYNLNNYLVYDDISDASGRVCGISFWGCSSNYNGHNWNECREDSMQFEVSFWADGSNNHPGSYIYSYIVNPIQTSTWAYMEIGQDVFGVVYHYEAMFDDCIEVNGGWFSIQGISNQDPVDCNFIWLGSSSPGDTCWTYGNGQWRYWNASASFCLLDSMSTAINNDNPGEPSVFFLNQNYPNPFNAQTTINYALLKQAHLTLDIFDILGRKITTLDDGIRPAGDYETVWDASDQASGLYFCRIKTAEYSETIKLLLEK